jgi:two-component system sensor histidine kinase MtrB
MGGDRAAVNGPQWSLSRTLSGGAIILALIGSASWLLLLALAATSARTVSDLAANTESVRMAEEAELSLLLYERTTDPVARHRLQGELRRQLSHAHEYVSTDEEAAILRAAEAAVTRHFAVPPQGGLDDAFQAIDDLARYNVDQARETEERTRRWARWLGWGAMVLATAMMGAAAVLVRWLATRAFRPFLVLAAQIREVPAGRMTPRVDVTGPSEVREVARRYNELADELERRRHAQMTFLGAVAHDLRNALSALKLAAFALQGDPGPADPVRIGHLVRRQVDRLDRMVGDLLDTARIEAGELRLDAEEVDLCTTAGQVAELFRPGAPTHDIQVALPEAPVIVTCDPMRIEQVLSNLLSNAIKYSPEGGPVRVTVGASDREARVAVSDSGIGIPLEEQDRLFQPFRRGGMDRQSAIPGVGLGLYIARRIVEAHGGRIELRSTLHVGSEFTVVLPAVRVAGALRAAPS